MKPTSYPGHLSFLISDGGEGVSFVPRTLPISERRNSLETVIKHMKFIQNGHFTKYDVSLYIKNFIR